MKTSWSMTLLPAVLLLAGNATEAKAADGCRQAGKMVISKRAARRRQAQFFLPGHIYAVPGVETNIYFNNIFLTVNPANYVFDVACAAGRNDGKRWRFIPAAGDAGKSYPLTITVYDQDGEVAEGSATVHVAPPDAGRGRKVSILIVGDSLTNATVYPARLHTLCQGENNPKLTMIGSHCGSGRKPVPGGVAHEGYGGWTWYSFLHNWNPQALDSNAGYNRASSKFLVKKNGEAVFDLASYLKKYNGGKAPDVITFQLGVNDVFSATDANREERIAAILNHADKLIAAFRKEAPNALIGVGYVTAGANQDAFGNNYRCGQTAWGYFKNSFRLNQAMAKHFAASGDKNLVMIPTQLNLDREHNFPSAGEAVNSANPEKTVRQNNGVHPAATGYNQIGDTFFAWLKYQLAKNGK